MRDGRRCPCPLRRLAGADPDADLVHLTVADNGAGIPRATVQRILNFATRTSDKAVYRSPTRGAQGNALKTVLGIPWALGVRGATHDRGPGAPPYHHARGGPGRPRACRSPRHRRPPATRDPDHALPCRHATRDCDPRYWGRAFALFNPHVSVKICEDGHAGFSLLTGPGRLRGFLPSDGHLPWRAGAKYLPSDLTSAWWYSPEDLTRLVFSHIAASKAAPRPESAAAGLREAVSQSLGAMPRPRRSARRCQGSPISVISTTDETAVQSLHAQMRATGKPPSPDVLGAIGEAHFRRCFERWYGVKRFWYRREKGPA